MMSAYSPPGTGSQHQQRWHDSAIMQIWEAAWTWFKRCSCLTDRLTGGGDGAANGMSVNVNQD